SDARVCAPLRRGRVGGRKSTHRGDAHTRREEDEAGARRGRPRVRPATAEGSRARGSVATSLPQPALERAAGDGEGRAPTRQHLALRTGFAADRLRADKRHGARHPRGRHRAHLRAVLLDADEGHGTRSLGHAGHRAPPRRSHRGDERRGPGHDLQRHSPRGFADTLENGCRTESLTASSRPTATAPRKSRASSLWTTRRTCASPPPPSSNRRATRWRPPRADARPWRWPRTLTTTSP